MELFGFCFKKLFLRTFFENTKNTICVLTFSKKGYCYLNLVFFGFSMLFKKKKIKYVLYLFLVLFVFQNKKQFLKTVNMKSFKL